MMRRSRALAALLPPCRSCGARPCMHSAQSVTPLPAVAAGSAFAARRLSVPMPHFIVHGLHERMRA